MSKNKPTPGGRAKRKSEVSLVRSSAAEYLTFVAASGQGGVEAVYADENVWLSQKMMGQLYDVDVRTISYHLKNVFADHELEENSVIQSFRITAADGKTYDTGHYNLSAIIAVGYKVMIRLYWDIGRLIAARQEQEGWGAGVVPRLAVDLKNELPEEKGFSEWERSTPRTRPSARPGRRSARGSVFSTPMWHGVCLRTSP